MTASGIADALQLGTWTPAPDPEAALSRLLVGSLGLAAAVLAVLVIVRLVTGTLGGVSSDGGRGDLPRQPAALGPTTTVVLGLVTLVAVAVALRGTIAAAARAVASSESGLHTLWMQTAADGLAATGSILLVAGLVEWVLLRRAQRRALWLDEAQARAERRASGSGRR